MTAAQGRGGCQLHAETLQQPQALTTLQAFEGQRVESATDAWVYRWLKWQHACFRIVA